MREVDAISLTTPSFNIDKEATPEQIEFLQSFESRILQDPELYRQELNYYLLTVNPERAKQIGALENTSSLFDHLKENSVAKLQAMFDWNEYLHGELGVASRLIGFDPTTEAEIASDEPIKKIQTKLREASRPSNRSSNPREITERLRIARMNLFMGRLMLIGANLENVTVTVSNTESLAEPA